MQKLLKYLPHKLLHLKNEKILTLVSIYDLEYLAGLEIEDRLVAELNASTVKMLSVGYIPLFSLVHDCILPSTQQKEHR